MELGRVTRKEATEELNIGRLENGLHVPVKTQDKNEPDTFKAFIVKRGFYQRQNRQRCPLYGSGFAPFLFHRCVMIILIVVLRSFFWTIYNPP